MLSAVERLAGIPPEMVRKRMRQVSVRDTCDAPAPACICVSRSLGISGKRSSLGKEQRAADKQMHRIVSMRPESIASGTPELVLRAREVHNFCSIIGVLDDPLSALAGAFCLSPVSGIFIFRWLF